MTEKCSTNYLTELKLISKLAFKWIMSQQPLTKIKSKIVEKHKTELEQLELCI